MKTLSSILLLDITFPLDILLNIFYIHHYLKNNTQFLLKKISITIIFYAQFT